MNYANLYATLDDFQAWLTMRGQPAMTADAGDDAVMTGILNKVSRWIEEDKQTARTFYPRYETRTYDVPQMHKQYFWVGNSYFPSKFTGQLEDLDLRLDDDLLTALTVTNGDGVVLSAVSPLPYILLPHNNTPKDVVSIIGSKTNYYWKPDTDGNWRDVISIAGLWGYRTRYSQRAWSLVGTLGAAITDTTGLSFTMSAGHTVTRNQILQIDTEIFNVASVAINTVTVNQRGDNGSTAATHLNGASVYAWNPEEELQDTVLQIAQRVYSERSGQASAGQVQVTGAGVVIRPSSVPDDAMATIESLRRTVVWS